MVGHSYRVSVSKRRTIPPELGVWGGGGGGGGGCKSPNWVQGEGQELFLSFESKGHQFIERRNG